MKPEDAQKRVAELDFEKLKNEANQLKHEFLRRQDCLNKIGKRYPHLVVPKTESIESDHFDDFVTEGNHTVETVCQEADRLVSGEKREAYGPPEESLGRLAKMWEGVLGIPITSRQVTLCLVLLKVGRETHKHSRDNLVDICGYAKLLSLLEGD